MNKQQRKEYDRRRYLNVIKPKKYPGKSWTAGKRAWVKCPFCANIRQFRPIKDVEPEVFGMAYGGYGKLRKITESELKENAFPVWEGIKKNYISMLKDATWKFVFRYCSDEEIKEKVKFLNIPLTSNTSAISSLIGSLVSLRSSSSCSSYSQSSSLVAMKPRVEVNSKPRVEVTAKWQN